MSNTSTHTTPTQPLDNPVIVEAIAEKIKAESSVVNLKDGKMTIGTADAVSKASEVFASALGLKDKLNMASFAIPSQQSMELPVKDAVYSQDANPEKIKSQLSALVDLNNLKFEPEQKAELSKAVDAQQLTGEQQKSSESVGNFSQRIAEERSAQMTEPDTAMQR